MKFTNDIKTLIGLLLVTIIMGVYGFYTNNPIDKNNLIEQEGTLKEVPIRENQGGDMPREYIRFELNENSTKYYLIDCAYDVANKNDILNLSSGCSVIFLIRKEESNQDKAYLFSLRAKYDNTYLLNINDYNKCYTNRWRLLVPLAIILLLVLIYRILVATSIIKTIRK